MESYGPVTTSAETSLMSSEDKLRIPLTMGVGRTNCSFNEDVGSHAVSPMHATSTAILASANDASEVSPVVSRLLPMAAEPQEADRR